MGNKRGKERSRKRRSASTTFKRKTFHGSRLTLKLPSESMPESPQNTPLEASTSSYKSRPISKAATFQTIILLGERNDRKFTFLVIVRTMWSIITYPNRYFSIKWTSESNFILPRMWCKRNFNREQFRKKNMDLFAVLNCLVIIVLYLFIIDIFK